MGEMPAKLDESLLRDLPPFSRLERREIREILDLSAPKRHAAGQAVFGEGLPAERFYLLLDGYVRVIRTTPAGEQIIALHIAPGQLLGIAAALGRDTYPATAMAAVECLTLSWPTRLWPRFVERYQGFATETYRIVGDRVGEMQSRIAEMATQQVEQRVAGALLRLAEQAGRPAGAGLEIDVPLTRKEISEMTGTTLHTVSRLLSGWEREGVVQSRSRRITLLRPDRLGAIRGG